MATLFKVLFLVGSVLAWLPDEPIRINSNDWLVAAATTNNTCFTGVQTAFPNRNYNSTVYCNGMCGSATAIIAQDGTEGSNTTAFFCFDPSICSSLNLSGNCTQLPTDKDVTICCCNPDPDGNNCNILLAGFSLTAPDPIRSTDPPIACYSGIWTNGNETFPGSYQACQGDCVSIQLDTKSNGAPNTATLYTCDAGDTTYCRTYGILNKCLPIEPGMTGCCCNGDACIDPYKGRAPTDPLKCFSGINVAADNFTVGDSISCDGMCVSVETRVSSKTVQVFQCTTKDVCTNGLQVNGNACNTFYNGNSLVTACCCDDSINCNSNRFNLSYVIPSVDWNKTPLACWSGFYQNGQPSNGTKPGWASCYGDCASIQWNTGTSEIMTIYSCDPVQFVNQLNVDNSCGAVDGLSGLKVCSCSTSGCLDGSSNIPIQQRNLTCYTGIYTTVPNKTSGSYVYCNGKCGAAQTTLAGADTTVFFCLDNSVCDSLKLQNSCGPFPGEKDITGCCCDNVSNCNIIQTNMTDKISVSGSPSALPDPPIACYTGVWVNGAALAPGGLFQSCVGDCVSITLNTTVGSSSQVATIYTCDPSIFCRTNGILNNCADIEPSMTGCCCNTDVCIDPIKGITPSDPLVCFAGVNVPADNYTIGSDVKCTGKCVSIKTQASGKDVAVYQCVQQAVCRDGLGIQDNGCNTFMNGNTAVNACCCDSGKHCNAIADNLNYTFYQANLTATPLACWNGFYQNGKPSPDSTPGWASCYGDCASIQWKTNTTSTMTLFTCDPVSFVTQLSVDNACGTVDSLEGLKVCSCDRSGCLDGTSNIPNFVPTGLTCYVGVETLYPGAKNGTTVYCDGKCGSATAVLGPLGSQFNTTAFFCMDQTVCNALGLANSCGPFPGDKDIMGCCCDSGNNCNVGMAGFNSLITPPPVKNATDPPIACYAGVWVNGSPLSAGVYQSCYGDCVSIALNTSMTGQNHTATLYACDPSTLCRNLDILNKCSAIEPGMKGCCCDTDACIDPSRKRSPDSSLICFAGISIPADKYVVGDDVSCTGKCISIKTKANGKDVAVYQCAQKSVCKDGLGIPDNGCTSFKNGQDDVSACCCDDSNNCNTMGDTLNYVIPNVNWTAVPLACWSGFYQNNVATGTPGWSNCYGDCASFQWKTSNSATMTLYGCDPVQVISQLGVDNACGAVDGNEGLRVCSCDQSGCLDGTSNIPKFAPTGLTCYVGIQTTFTNITAYGSTVYCDGKCGSASATLSGYNTTVFFCMDQTICNSLNLANSCGQFPGDKDVTGCCCDDNNNCNVAYANMTTTVTPPPVKNATDPPIACYAGVWVNGAALSAGVYQSCYGDCVSITLNTSMVGQNHIATLYSCDPSSFCKAYGILGKCSSIEPGMKGCCCNDDACIDPNRNRSPDNQLYCFAGVSVPANNYTVGDDVTCDGKCISIKTKANGTDVRVYQCVKRSVCRDGLNIDDNGCTSFKNGGDDVTACCCDESNNCNTVGDNLNYVIPVANWTSAPIACWSGFYQNGKPNGSPGFINCYGDCASVQWKSSNSSDTMTLYTCDPVAFVSQLNVNNSCGSVDQLEGLKVCSCNFSGCLDGTSNIPNSKPSCPSAASNGDLWTFISLLLLLFVYRNV